MRVLITGASSGLGRDMAYELAKRGFDLVLVARREDRLLEIKETVSVNTDIITADLTKPEEVIRVYNEAGKIDMLINNAGFGVFGEFSQTELSAEMDMLYVNVRAMHMLMKLYINDFEKQGGGRILNVASAAAFCPGPMFAGYYATKAYMYRLSVSVARELEMTGSKTKISVLCPGPVKTEFGEVAKVSFGLYGLDSKYVAEYAVEKLLKGKKVIVPGKLMQCARFLTKLLPDSILARITAKIQSQKVLKGE